MAIDPGFAQTRLASFGLAWSGVVSVVSLGAAWLAPYAPNAPDGAAILKLPGPAHALGTDELGRDILSRVS